MRFVVLLVGLSGLCCAAPAAAECNLSAAPAAPLVHVTYDPFGPTQQVLDLSVQLRNSGDEPCQARLYVRPSAGQLVLESSGDRLNMRLEGQEGAGAAQAGEFGPYVITLAPAQSTTLLVRAVVPPQQVVPRGTYTGDFALRLEDGDGREISLAGGGVRLQANVLARTEMSISGSSAARLAGGGMAPSGIAFGAAHSGQTERAYVNVWSNGSVTVSLSSENGGVLKLIDNPALPPIRYSTRFDGSDLSLEAPASLVRTPPMTVGGASYELALTLGDIARNFAGQYQDVITVTVTPN
jgi:hypothetical protein